MVTEDIKSVVLAYVDVNNQPIFHFSKIEEVELDSEDIYPLVLAYSKTSFEQPDVQQRAYDVNIICLEKMPERLVSDTDLSYENKKIERWEFFKKFLAHTVYYLTSPKFKFCYTLQNDLIRYEDAERFLEWDLFATRAEITLISNVEGFVCELTFDESNFV